MNIVTTTKQRFPCNCCQYYTWRQFENDSNVLAEKIKEFQKRDFVFNDVYGPIRGGWTAAVKLSHLLDIPCRSEKPSDTSTLIIDDIADTGKTLNNYAISGYFIVTYFYHRQSLYVPKIWFHEKKEKYIIFPWEKRQCARKKSRP